MYGPDDVDGGTLDDPGDVVAAAAAAAAAAASISRYFLRRFRACRPRLRRGIDVLVSFLEVTSIDSGGFGGVVEGADMDGKVPQVLYNNSSKFEHKYMLRMGWRLLRAPVTSMDCHREKLGVRGDYCVVFK